MRALSTGWRGVLTAAAILIGLINPLLCVLHCALVVQHAALDQPADQRSRFYCDLSAQIDTAYAPAETHALAGQAHGATTSFFGGAEGLLGESGSLSAALALVAWGLAHRHAARRFRTLAPPVPPPRTPLVVLHTA